MENLNAEQVKKALECCLEDVANCNNCPYERYCDMHENNMLRDALALINSQEQRIGELADEKSKVFEKGAENLTRLEEAYLKLEAENLKLTEENERLRAIPEQICEQARQMCFIVGDEEYVTLCELDQIAKEMLGGAK